MQIPELVAHRGYALHYPENTIVAVEAAVAEGARFIEIDVQLSADKVPVLFHDRTLDRLCRAEGAIHQFTREQLREFRVSEFDRFGYKFAQTPIATLAEFGAVLARSPQLTAFIELKRLAIEQFGVNTVLERVRLSLAPVITQCVLISYHVPILAAARQLGDLRVGVILEKWHHHRNSDVRAVRPEFLFCDAGDLPGIGKLGASGAKVVIYEITDPKVALKLARRGVGYIETFAIGEMLKAFNQIAERPT